MHLSFTLGKSPGKRVTVLVYEHKFVINVPILKEKETKTDHVCDNGRRSW